MSRTFRTDGRQLALLPALRTVRELAQATCLKSERKQHRNVSCQEHVRDYGFGQTLTFALTEHNVPPPYVGGQPPFFACCEIRTLVTVPQMYLSDGGGDPRFRVCGQWQTVVVPNGNNHWVRLRFEYRLENEENITETFAPETFPPRRC